MVAERVYADPPGMPADERMAGAELRVVREHLGLTTRWLAEHLGVQERTVHRWEADVSPIPDGVRCAVEDLEARTAEVVSAAAAACLDTPDPAILTYRTDADYREHHPEQPWSASWHRAVTARVAREVPGLVVGWWRPDTPTTGDRMAVAYVNHILCCYVDDDGTPTPPAEGSPGRAYVSGMTQMLLEAGIVRGPHDDALNPLDAVRELFETRPAVRDAFRVETWGRRLRLFTQEV